MAALACSTKTSILYSHGHLHDFSHEIRIPKNSTFFCIPTNSSPRRHLLNLPVFAHPSTPHFNLKHTIVGLATFASTTILFMSFGLRVYPAAASALLPLSYRHHSPIYESLEGDVKGETGRSGEVNPAVDEELTKAFEAWKSKSFALSVPLNIVALRGSMPPSWTKDFLLSQGKRSKLQVKFRGTLAEIFSDLSSPFTKEGSTDKIKSSSVIAADLVSLGDSWLSFAISKAIIEPIKDAEEQDWFKSLSPKWKTYLRRNGNGDVDGNGEIWAAPYRWGCVVIAYKKSMFQKHNLSPIVDWADLWRPELAGKISMVNSPREVVGLVLKHMGASYNTTDVELQVEGGRNVVQQNLALLGKQVRLFDSMNYLKSLSLGDVWVAVGCSSDVVPAAKRLSNVAVVVPKSGSNLWADLWVIPAASRLETTRIGGRIRGASPLIHQWIEFCLQAAREAPFKQGATAGASPSSLEETPQTQVLESSGMPTPEVSGKCEFLEPLSETALDDYGRLINGMHTPRRGLVHFMHYEVFKMIHTLWSKVCSN